MLVQDFLAEIQKAKDVQAGYQKKNLQTTGYWQEQQFSDTSDSKNQSYE